MLGGELRSWPAVTTRRMFGMTVFYRKGKIFAALPLTKAFQTPNSIAFKLYSIKPGTAKLMRTDARIGPVTDSKEKPGGWIRFEVRTAEDLRDALKWFDLAYCNCLSKNNSKS